MHLPTSEVRSNPGRRSRSTTLPVKSDLQIANIGQESDFTNVFTILYGGEQVNLHDNRSSSDALTQSIFGVTQKKIAQNDQQTKIFQFTNFSSPRSTFLTV
jgi:hypothetical protein